MQTYGSSHPPFLLWLITSAYLLFSAVNSPNFLISIPVFLYPLFLYRLFWLNNQANVIFWGLLFQWLSVTSQLFYSTILGISVSDYMKGEVYPIEYFTKTILLSIIALYFFSLGIYFAVKSLKIANINDALQEYSPKALLTWYLIISIIIYSSRAAIWQFPSLVQYFYFFFYIKWGFFLITFYFIHKQAPQLRWVLYFIHFNRIYLRIIVFFC